MIVAITLFSFFFLLIFLVFLVSLALPFGIDSSVLFGEVLGLRWLISHMVYVYFHIWAVFNQLSFHFGYTAFSFNLRHVFDFGFFN